MRNVLLRDIRVDGGTQSREKLDQATVDEYAEALDRGVLFPPLVAYHDGEYTWLADGFHRYYAGKKVHVDAMQVDWREGTVEAAKMYAARANGTHGLRRTAGDKRRAVEMVLSTEEGRSWTQELIAKHCNVAQSYVSLVASNYHSDNPQKNPQRGERLKLTKAEKKRALIAETAAKKPGASSSAIARELGVDRETVAALRSKGDKVSADRKRPAEQGAAPTARGGEPRAPGYASQRARKAARAALEAAAAAKAAMSEGEWRRFLRELAAVVPAERSRT